MSGDGMSCPSEQWREDHGTCVASVASADIYGLMIQVRHVREDATAKVKTKRMAQP